MRKPGLSRVGYCTFLVCLVLIAPVLISGCAHYDDRRRAKAIFAEANDLFFRGSYPASLDKYSEIIKKYPAFADRGLFEMGIVYAHSNNERKDYRKSLECFQKLMKDYPASEYRQNAQMMIFTIGNIALKDKTIGALQRQIETLRNDIQGKDSEIRGKMNEIQVKENEIATLQKKIEGVEKKFFSYATRHGSVDKILIEKSARRMTLISQGEVVKTYKVALGGNPIGPKERHGDNKTPEGTYVIDARNRNSQYHLSLHISYPNERDKKRAKELGVSPGGDIMIHGIKNGFSSVGNAHAGIDWTKGCIAVSDEEIEEIEAAAPNGTVVEIRP